MCDIFHFIVTINHVDACIDQVQVGTQLHIAGIEHIRKQRKVIFVAVTGHAVILVGQLHAFLLCAKVGERSQELA